MGVNVTDNSGQIRDAMRAALRTGLEACGMKAETYAKQDCPVDTGRLMNSITHQTSGNECVIGTNVEYAVYQEFGNYSHAKGQAHYLKNSVASHGSEYKKLIKQAMKG